MRRVFVFFVVLVSVCAIAQVKKTDLVGKWKGRFEVDATKSNKKLTKEQLDAMKNIAKSHSYLMEFKTNGTYSAVMKEGSNKGDTTSGLWRLNKTTLILTDTIRHGKPILAKDQKEMMMTVSKKGKELWLKIPDSAISTYIVLSKP